MRLMGILADRLKAYFDKAEHSFYKVAMSVDLDPTNARKILFSERTTTFEKQLELLEKISKSPLMNIDQETLVSWLAMDYFSKDVIIKAANDVLKEKRV